VIRALKAQPERLAAARSRNVVNALLRHDNVYRWRDVLGIAGLPETPALRQRQNRLEALAEAVMRDDDTGRLAMGEFDRGARSRSAG
jgi:hypothetical protein